jgi:hypothetical protein
MLMRANLRMQECLPTLDGAGMRASSCQLQRSFRSPEVARCFMLKGLAYNCREIAISLVGL